MLRERSMSYGLSCLLPWQCGMRSRKSILRSLYWIILPWYRVRIWLGLRGRSWQGRWRRCLVSLRRLRWGVWWRLCCSWCCWRSMHKSTVMWRQDADKYTDINTPSLRQLYWVRSSLRSFSVWAAASSSVGLDDMNRPSMKQSVRLEMVYYLQRRKALEILHHRLIIVVDSASSFPPLSTPHSPQSRSPPSPSIPLPSRTKSSTSLASQPSSYLSPSRPTSSSKHTLTMVFTMMS